MRWSAVQQYRICFGSVHGHRVLSPMDWYCFPSTMLMLNRNDPPGRNVQVVPTLIWWLCSRKGFIKTRYGPLLCQAPPSCPWTSFWQYLHPFGCQRAQITSHEWLFVLLVYPAITLLDSLAVAIQNNEPISEMRLHKQASYSYVAM